jgi:hypothetical protein
MRRVKARDGEKVWKTRTDLEEDDDGVVVKEARCGLCVNVLIPEGRRAGWRRLKTGNVEDGSIGEGEVVKADVVHGA